MDKDDVARGRNSGTSKDGASYRERITEVEPVRNGESSSSAPQLEESGVEEEWAMARGARRRWWQHRERGSYSHTHFKVYKRRWFGLAQLVLLNVVVSWDVSCCGWLTLHFTTV